MNLKICIFFLWQSAHCQLSPILKEKLGSIIKEELIKLVALLNKTDKTDAKEISRLQDKIECLVDMPNKFLITPQNSPQRRRVSR